MAVCITLFIPKCFYLWAHVPAKETILLEPYLLSYTLQEDGQKEFSTLCDSGLLSCGVWPD